MVVQRVLQWWKFHLIEMKNPILNRDLEKEILIWARIRQVAAHCPARRQFASRPVLTVIFYALDYNPTVLRRSVSSQSPAPPPPNSLFPVPQCHPPVSCPPNWQPPVCIAHE